MYLPIADEALTSQLSMFLRVTGKDQDVIQIEECAAEKIT